MIVGSIPRQVLDRFRASQVTQPPRQGLYPGVALVPPKPWRKRKRRTLHALGCFQAPVSLGDGGSGSLPGLYRLLITDDRLAKACLKLFKALRNTCGSFLARAKTSDPSIVISTSSAQIAALTPD
jgi:hypothetical protein